MAMRPTFEGRGKLLSKPAKTCYSDVVSGMHDDPPKSEAITRPTFMGLEKLDEPARTRYSDVASGKSLAESAGKGRSIATVNCEQSGPPKPWGIERSASAGEKKFSPGSARESHPVATVSGKWRIPLEKGNSNHGRSGALTMFPAQGKVPQRKYKIIPLYETFSRGAEFKAFDDGTLEISLGRDMLIFKHESRDRFRVFGNTKMPVYCFETSIRVVRAFRGSEHELKDTHYVIYTSRGIPQQNVEPLWSFLEAENRHLLDWKSTPIIGAFEIQKQED
jgi:hypothetical protein